MSDQFTTERRRTFGELPVSSFGSVQTAATGTNYTALSSAAGARLVRFMNPTVDIEVRVGSSGSTITAPAYQETRVFVANNANELQVRRKDTSNTQVTVELSIEGY